jgi:hypothetical protein
MDAQKDFFTLPEAAEYCSYAPDTFRKLLKYYALKRCGPAKNRFAREELKAFMLEPEAFKIRNGRSPKRTPKTVAV